MKIFFKFTNTDTQPIKIKDEKKFLIGILSNQFAFGYTNLTYYGYYKFQGWLYDFTDILNKYIVKSDYHLIEMYQLNKTLLRKSVKGIGKIHYIKKI